MRALRRAARLEEDAARLRAVPASRRRPSKRLRAAAPYRGAARDILLAYKFRGADYLARHLAALLARRLPAAAGFDEVTAVPAKSPPFRREDARRRAAGPGGRRAPRAPVRAPAREEPARRSGRAGCLSRDARRTCAAPSGLAARRPARSSSWTTSRRPAPRRASAPGACARPEPRGSSSGASPGPRETTRPSSRRIGPKARIEGRPAGSPGRVAGASGGRPRRPGGPRWRGVRRAGTGLSRLSTRPGPEMAFDRGAFYTHRWTSGSAHEGETLFFRRGRAGVTRAGSPRRACASAASRERDGSPDLRRRALGRRSGLGRSRRALQRRGDVARPHAHGGRRHVRRRVRARGRLRPDRLQEGVPAGARPSPPPGRAAEGQRRRDPARELLRVFEDAAEIHALGARGPAAGRRAPRARSGRRVGFARTGAERRRAEPRRRRRSLDGCRNGRLRGAAHGGGAARRPPQRLALQPDGRVQLDHARRGSRRHHERQQRRPRARGRALFR